MKTSALNCRIMFNVKHYVYQKTAKEAVFFYVIVF